MSKILAHIGFPQELGQRSRYPGVVMTSIAEQFQALVHDAAVQAADMAADATLLQLQVLVADRHNGTGELHDSIYRDSLEESESVFRVGIGATAEQASWTDSGTDPHPIPIDSTGPWPMHWEDDMRGEVFAWHVEHPGYAGSFWFTDTTSEDAWAEELSIAFDLVAQGT